jgi:hypothetical protein
MVAVTMSARSWSKTEAQTLLQNQRENEAEIPTPAEHQNSSTPNPPRAELVKMPDASVPPHPSEPTAYAPDDVSIVVKLIIAYMQATQNGRPTSLKPYCTSVLDNFYGKRSISVEYAEKDIADYYKIWPKQTTSFDPAQCKVEPETDGSFAVALPFSWSVSDGGKTKNGTSRLHATVRRAADGRFLISAVSNETAA